MTCINGDIDDQACAEIILQTFSNPLTFSNRLTTPSSAWPVHPKQLQPPREYGRTTPRPIENTKMARDFDGFSNPLTSPASPGYDLPKQLQTPHEYVRTTPRPIENTKMARDFDGFSNPLTFSNRLTPPSSACPARPKQLQTPHEYVRRPARLIKNTKMARDFVGFSNPLTFSNRLTPETPPARIIRHLSVHTMEVYDWCMTRTNVDIDDRACAEVMRRYRLATKREAINLALRMLAAEIASVDEARSLRGIGWEGDLEAMRSNRAP